MNEQFMLGKLNTLTAALGRLVRELSNEQRTSVVAAMQAAINESPSKDYESGATDTQIRIFQAAQIEFKD